MKKIVIGLMILAVSVFSNTNQFIDITALNQTTQYYSLGDTVNITWNSEGIDRLSLQFCSNFNVDSVNNWSTITNDIPASNGVYQWVLPQSTNSNCRIRILSSSDSLIYDINDYDFNVADIPKQKIKIVTPSGGETLNGNATLQNISWTVFGSYYPFEVSIEYSTDNGENWDKINSEKIYSTSKSIVWDMPDLNNNDLLLRIYNVADSSIGDTTHITINKQIAHIDITALNQTTQYYSLGDTVNITWNSEGIDRLSLQFCSNFNVDSVNNWSTITNDIPASNGVYQWVLPQSTNSNCRIRILSSSDSLIYDINDYDFNVADIPKQKIKIVTPSGGETLNGNATLQNISWTVFGSYYPFEVSIEYSTDNGENWDKINSEKIYSTSKSIVWDMPDLNNNDLLLRIYNVADSSIGDTIDKSIKIIDGGNTAITLSNKAVVRDITSLLIYPNPVSSDADRANLLIPTELSGEWHITIYDALGNLMDEAEFEANGGTTYTWDLHSRYGVRVASGSYVLIGEFTDNTGRTQIFKRMIGVK